MNRSPQDIFYMQLNWDPVGSNHKRAQKNKAYWFMQIWGFTIPLFSCLQIQ